MYISDEKLLFDQENNFYLISLIIFITCLEDNLWISQRELNFEFELVVIALKLWVWRVFVDPLTAKIWFVSLPSVCY